MKTLQKLFTALGVQVRPLKSVEAEARRSFEERWATEYIFVGNAKIQTVLDIGAGAGQFARVVHHAFPPLAELHSFESKLGMHPQLKGALGDYTGHIIHPFIPGEGESLDHWAADRVLLPEILIRIRHADPLSILTGSANTLKRARFVVVHLELLSHPPEQSDFRKISALLFECGYSFRGHAGQAMQNDFTVLASDLIFENLNPLKL